MEQELQEATISVVAGAAPFFARLVETALREVDRGVIEATQAMGATTTQIVLVPGFWRLTSIWPAPGSSDAGRFSEDMTAVAWTLSNCVESEST